VTVGAQRGAVSSTSSYSYLFDLDDDLATEFDLRMRTVARQIVTAHVDVVPAGDWDAGAWFATVERGLGILVVDGVLALDTFVGDRVATELVGAGDLLQPCGPGQDDLLECSFTWKVLVPARLARLDAAFVERVRPWPLITEVLLRRAERRAAELNVQRAIAGHPRLEVRIVLLLWHLAGRWGRVEPGGVSLRLPLTHRVLGHLVGAERPSVSHALTRLAQAELVTGHGSEWHLHGTCTGHLAALARREDTTSLTVG
jgi:CRP/FNR family transcriptional regulator, cyclic AMP receptor protein